MTLDVRIDGQTIATSTPADPGLDPLTPSGTPGYWQPGNTGTGTPATRLKAWWFNWVQESLRNVITAAGLTPDRTLFTQFVNAIRGIAFPLSGVYSGSPIAGNNTYKLIVRLSPTIPAGGAIARVEGWLAQAFTSGAKTWGIEILVDGTTAYTTMGDTSTLPILTVKAFIPLSAGAHNIDLKWLGQDSTVSTSTAFLDIFGVN